MLVARQRERIRDLSMDITLKPMGPPLTWEQTLGWPSPGLAFPASTREPTAAGSTPYINIALIAAYFLERFFNWQIAAIGLVCLAIAYGLCRVLVCAVCFIRRRCEKS